MLTRAKAVAVVAFAMTACASGGSPRSQPSSRPPVTPPPGPTVTASPPGSPPPVIVTPPPAVTASTSVPPTTRPATPAPVVVTAAANGSTVGVRLGQQVVVTLSSGERWAEPVSGDDAVLHRLSGSADAATGSATATFSAVAAGTAKVTSSRRCLPKPGQVCAQYVALWSVTVVVR